MVRRWSRSHAPNASLPVPVGCAVERKGRVHAGAEAPCFARPALRIVRQLISVPPCLVLATRRAVAGKLILKSVRRMASGEDLNGFFGAVNGPAQSAAKTQRKARRLSLLAKAQAEDASDQSVTDKR